MRCGIVIGLAAMLLGGAVEPALAKGVFKGTFGDVRFKSRKAAAGCSYTRSVGLFLVTGAQLKRRGRLQTGTSASGFGTDPSTPGATFPIVLTAPVTATFFTGDPVTPALWTGNPELGPDQNVELTLTGYKRGKVSGTLRATLVPTAGTTGLPIEVDATFTIKCSIF
jgi:hypothetical protein